MIKRSAMAPLIVVILVAVGLIGGTTAGYVFREPLKKMIKGVTTEEEIQQAVEEATGEGQSKFELEGVATSVNVASKTVTVKIKSSTNSIKEMQLSEAPIIISDTASIQSGNEKNLTIADILINSQIHVGGTIASGTLTADKVLIQKEDVDEQGEGKKFELSGKVTAIGTGSITVNVTAASKKAKSQRGKDLEIAVTGTTIIEKNNVSIALTDIKLGDEVEVEGTVDKNLYTAVKINVKVTENGITITPSPEPSSTVSASGNGNNRGNSSNSGGHSPNANSNKND